MSHTPDMNTLFAENINTVMDQMDDPEQMVIDLIRDMEESFRMARETAEEGPVSGQDQMLELNLMQKELDEIRKRAVDLDIVKKAA